MVKSAKSPAGHHDATHQGRFGIERCACYLLTGRHDTLGCWPARTSDPRRYVVALPISGPPAPTDFLGGRLNSSALRTVCQADCWPINTNRIAVPARSPCSGGGQSRRRPQVAPPGFRNHPPSGCGEIEPANPVRKVAHRRVIAARAPMPPDPSAKSGDLSARLTLWSGRSQWTGGTTTPNPEDTRNM